MECKSYPDVICNCLFPMSINRNIVECKCVNCELSHTAHKVVLIETLWNVNKREAERNSEFCYSINRNIVECKYCSCSCISFNTCVLIETLWNVNLPARTNDKPFSHSINRNIVECKYSRILSYSTATVLY